MAQVDTIVISDENVIFLGCIFSTFIRPTFNVGLMKAEKLQPRTLKKVSLCLTNGNLVNNYNTIRWEGARRVSSPIGGPFL